MDMRSIKLNRSHFLIACCLAIIVFFRFWYIDKNPFWMDESYTYWFSSQSFYDLFFYIPMYEAHPPLYYALVKGWQFLFNSYLIQSERLLSLFISLAIFYVSSKTLSLFGNYYRSKSNFLIWLSLFGLSPILSWYSLEARPYILFMFSYSLAIYGFFSVVLEGKTASKKAWLTLTIGAILVNWSHITGAVFSLVIYGVLMLSAYVKEDLSVRRVFYSSFVVAIFSIPLILMLLFLISSWSESSWIEVLNTGYVWKVFVALFSEPSLSSFFWLFYNDIWSFKIIKLMVILFIPSLFLMSLYLAIKTERYVYLYLLVFTVAPFSVYIFVSLYFSNIFIERALTPSIIPYYLLLCLGVSLLKNNKIKWVLASVIFGISAVTAYIKLEYSVKEPWSEVREYFVSQYNESTTVFIFPNEVEVGLSGRNEMNLEDFNIIPLPYGFPSIGKSTFYPAGMPFVPGFSEKELDILGEGLKSVKNELIFISREESLFDPQGLIRTNIKSYGCKLSSSAEFGEISVTKYEDCGSFE